MSDPAANLTELQTRTVARLADAFSASANGKPVPVLSEAIGDLGNQMARQLGSLGIVCVVLTPVGKPIPSGDLRSDPDLLFSVPLIVQVQENVTINQGRSGTKIHALTAAAAILKRLHFWNTGLNPGHAKFNRVWREDPSWELIEDEPVLTYNVNLRTEVRL